MKYQVSHPPEGCVSPALLDFNPEFIVWPISVFSLGEELLNLLVSAGYPGVQ